MALDDLVEDKEAEKEKEKLKELKDTLGIENKEDLDKLDDRLNLLAEIIIIHDKKIEELEDKL